MRYDPRVMGLAGMLGGAMGSGILGQLGMAGNLGTALSGLPVAAMEGAGMVPGGNYAALGAMLMQMMNPAGASPFMGSANGAPYAGIDGSAQGSFDDGGTIAEALQRVAKAVVAQVKK